MELGLPNGICAVSLFSLSLRMFFFSFLFSFDFFFLFLPSVYADSTQLDRSGPSLPTFADLCPA